MSYKLLNFFICLGLIGSTTGAFAQTRMLKLTPRQAVYYYAERGNVEQLLTLKQKYSLDLLDNQKNTALCEGIIRNNQTAIYSLLQAGANKDAKCVKKLVAQNTKASTAEKGLSTGAKTGIGAAIAALIGGVAVAAGGGGGGGGGGGEASPHVPSITLPGTGTLDLPNGSTVSESGTSIQTVNNTERRKANYENAVASVARTDSVVSVLATTTLANNTSVEDVNNAYSNMNKILVNQDFTNATKEDILLSLAMAGEDIGGLKDKSLDEVKTAAQSSAIQSKAEDVYARLGTERNLSLKDITFYDAEYAFDKADGAVFNFIIDKDGNLTGLQEVDDGGISIMKFNHSGQGVYQNNEGLVTYGFAYKSEHGGFYEEEVTLPKSTSIEGIKKALKETAQAHWGAESKETMDAMLAFIDTLDLTNGLIDEDVCEEQGNCAYKEMDIDAVTVKLDNKGRDVGLKYADFGTVTYDIAGNVIDIDKEVTLFYGGYEALSAKASDLPQVDTEMNFEGKALAQVWADTKDTDIETSKLYDGTANLTFKDGKETLVADFTDWHKVTFETNTSAYRGYDISVSGTAKDAAYTLENPYLAGVDIKYYGENPKNPDEVVGSATFWGSNDTHWVDAEMVFGATRK